MQDNWSKLNRNNRLNVTFDKFKEYLHMAVSQTKLPKNLRLEKIDINLSKNKFDNIMEQTETEIYHPLITFHATDNIDSVNSIFRIGYIKPGDINIETGIPHQNRIGAIYGDGIYSSCDLSYIQHYANPDNNSMMYFIINVVILGKFIQLAPYDIFNKSSESESIDTITLYGLKTIVSKNPKNIIPVGIVCVKSLNFLLHKNIKFDTDKTLTFTKITNDTYIVPLMNLPKKINKSTILNYIFLPSHLLKNKIILESVDNFSKSITNSIIIVYNNKSGIMVLQNKNLKNNIFQNIKFKNLSYENSLHELISKYSFSKQLDDLSVILDEILQIIIDTDIINSLYFLFDQTCCKAYDNKIRQICTDWHNGLQDSIVYVKSVYIGKIDYQNECVKDTLTLEYLDTRSDMVYKSRGCHTDISWNRFFFECDIIGSNEKINIATLLRAFIEDQTKLNTTDIINCNIPYPHGIYGHGFLLDLTTVPCWSVKTDTPVIFTGKPPQYLNIDGEIIKILIDENMNDALISMLTESCTRLFSKFKNTIIIDPYLYEYYNKSLNRFFGDLLNMLDKYINDGCYFTHIKNLYNNIQQLKNEMSIYSGIPGGLKFDGNFFARLKTMKFSKKIVKRIVHDIDNDKLKGHKSNSKDIESILIKQTKIFGYVCQMINTSASEIEPWLVMVKKVSPLKLSIADVYKFNEFGILPDIDIDFKWNSIIVLENGNQEIIKAFNAYQYTDNPYLILPNQKLSLLTSSCISILERVLLTIKINKLKNISTDNNMIISQLMLFSDIFQTINFSKQKYRDLINDIMSDPYVTLRDKQKIPSLTLALGLIAYYYNDIKHNIKDLSRAIFMESMYRTIETCMKTQKLDRIAILKKILLQPHDKASKFVNSIFQNRFISTSPFAIVSYMEFIVNYNDAHTSSLPEKSSKISTISQMYINSEISVTTFFNKYFDDLLQNKNSASLQTALVLIAIDKVNIDDKVNIFHFNSESIIEKYKTETEKTIQYMEEIMKINEAKKKNKLDVRNTKIIARLNKFIELQADYINPHSEMPKIFTKEEVKEMNIQQYKKGQKSNLYERLDNGLLKYHCCYPKCPDYLKTNFASEKDIKNNSRNGLFKHFKINFVLGNYYKGIHRESFKLFRKNVTEEMFKNKILDYIKNIKNNKNDVNDIKYVTDELCDSFCASQTETN